MRSSFGRGTDPQDSPAHRDVGERRVRVYVSRSELIVALATRVRVAFRSIHAIN